MTVWVPTDDGHADLAVCDVWVVFFGIYAAMTVSPGTRVGVNQVDDLVPVYDLLCAHRLRILAIPLLLRRIDHVLSKSLVDEAVEVADAVRGGADR